MTENVIRAFHDPVLELGSAILNSMTTIEKVVLACFENATVPLPLQSDKAALAAP
jgi:hypothetical protein